MRSIAKKFFTNLADFDPAILTLDNFRKINEAEKLYSMFGQVLFDYPVPFSERDVLPIAKDEVQSVLPYKYTVLEIDAVHSISSTWYAFTDDRFTDGFAFSGSNDSIRDELRSVSGLILLSTNGLNLMQNLRNSTRIKIRYCRTLEEVRQELQIRAVSRPDTICESHTA